MFELFNRGGAKATLIGHAILLAIVVMVSAGFDKDVNQVISGWFQAIGSVLAIVFAVYVAEKQNFLRGQESKESRLEQFMKLCGCASYSCEGLRQSMKIIERPGNPDVANIKRHHRIVSDCLRNIRTFDFSTIHDAEIASNWLRLEHCFSDYIGHIDDVGADKAYTRKSNLARCIERAEEELETLTSFSSKFH